MSLRGEDDGDPESGESAESAEKVGGGVLSVVKGRCVCRGVGVKSRGRLVSVNMGKVGIYVCANSVISVDAEASEVRDQS